MMTDLMVKYRNEFGRIKYHFGKRQKLIKQKKKKENKKNIAIINDILTCGVIIMARNDVDEYLFLSVNDCQFNFL